MSRSLVDYYEWLRIRAGIKSPLEAWLSNRDLDTYWKFNDTTGLWKFTTASALDPDSDMPPAGMTPPWQAEPSNYKLKSAILRAVDTVNRRCRVKDAYRFTDIPIAAVTDPGPLTFNMSEMGGFADRTVISIRRAYWQVSGDTQWQPLYPVLQSQLDLRRDNYLNDGPSTPYRISAEGQIVSLMPGPDVDGTLRVTVGAGLLAPHSPTEGFAGIPEEYDDDVLYVALVELAQIMPNDTEMTARAKTFEDEKERGINELIAYFDNLTLDEFVPAANLMVNIPRYARRN